MTAGFKDIVLLVLVLDTEWQQLSRMELQLVLSLPTAQQLLLVYSVTRGNSLTFPSGGRLKVVNRIGYEFAGNNKREYVHYR
jgi:hypothetical protein